MGFRINTNVSSIAAQRSLNRTNQNQATTLSKLSTGSRINKAADDAAGLAISEKMKAKIKSTAQANRNANDGISMLQTADGAFNEVSNMLVRLRELSVQSASDTVSDVERGFSNMEYQSLKEEIERIADSTEFNGTKLLTGEGDVLDFQIGVKNDLVKDRVNYDVGDSSAKLNDLGINDIGVSSKDGARDSISFIDEAIDKVNGHRATLGALQNRLVSTSNNLEISHENLKASNSRIRDVDYAEITAQNAKNNILASAGSAVLAQANSQGQNALRLIG